MPFDRDGGWAIFADELAQFGAGVADPQVRAIAGRVAKPVLVAVEGRRGVGSSTVARAVRGVLDGVNISHIADFSLDDVPDISVYVVAEVIKPEDCDAFAARPPVLVVLNKADLTGFGGAGPLAVARARAEQLSSQFGHPVEPMIGLLTVAALDDMDSGCWAALRALAAHPGDWLDGSFAGFLAADLPVSRQMRLRLLESLDLFGVALVVAALRRGSDQTQVRGLLRRVSGVDAVVAQLEAACAEVRYRRALEAVVELEAIVAAQSAAAPEISDFLRRDDTVLAQMATAMDVITTSGEDLGPDEPLARAVHWQRDSRESVNPLRRACGTDITRGSLRLWSRVGESGEVW